MTDEPYRWLEAIGNRREYVESQLKGGSPVFALSLAEGILLLGVGAGHSKVFEIFDRQALAGLGHPADLERIRQAVIDIAHLEGFTRAPADVSLRRLVSYGLGPQLKTAFEQIFSPPFLVRLILAEVGVEMRGDILAKVDFDGTFTLRPGGVVIVSDSDPAAIDAEKRLQERVSPETTLAAAAVMALEEWHQIVSSKSSSSVPAAGGWRESVAGRVIEAALLQRATPRAARYQALDPARLGLNDPSKS